RLPRTAASSGRRGLGRLPRALWPLSGLAGTWGTSGLGGSLARQLAHAGLRDGSLRLLHGSVLQIRGGRQSAAPTTGRPGGNRDHGDHRVRPVRAARTTDAPIATNIKRAISTTPHT